MAWSWGDGFDCYAATADMLTGYWDSGSVTGSFQTGRFAGSRCYQTTNANNVTEMVKISGVNDALHHIVVAFQATAVITGSSLSLAFTLQDGASAQCSVVFRSDGAILLTSGFANGTVLATYTGAFPLTTTWYAFEIEVNISSTAGYMNIRKNGNSVNDFSSATNLNTRTTANNYANRLFVGTGPNGSSNQMRIDDLYWRSDASSVPWMGDIRCYTRMPASDQSVQFSRTPTSFFVQNSASVANSGALSANIIRAVTVTANATGTLSSFSFNFNAGITGHAKMALYDNTGVSGGPGTLLAQSVELTNPGAGVNTFSVSSGPIVTRGTLYWVALWSDISISGVGPVGGVTTDILNLTYTTSFPSTLAGFTAPGAINGMGSNGISLVSLNAGCVNEAQQDATTSYVYDSTVNDADFYGIASIASTPVATIAVTTRGYMQKSDAGTRTAAVQLKSGSATVASPTLTLTTSGWQWAWRMDTVDPNTSAAWTPAAVNNAQVGPKVIA